MRPPFFFFVLLPLVRLVGVKWLRWWPLALSSLQQQLLQSPRGQWEREMGKITDDLKLLRKKDYTRVEPAGPCCKREKLAKKSPSFFPESYTLNGKWAKIIASMSSSSHVVWARPESCIKRETHWSDRSTNVLRRKIEEISWSTCLSSTRIENGNLCRQNSTISLFFVPWLENSHKQSCHHSFFGFFIEAPLNYAVNFIIVVYPIFFAPPPKAEYCPCMRVFLGSEEAMALDT